GKGFHDTTRIADSRPEIWSEICLTNREAILAALAECQGNLEQFRAALAAEDGPALERLFEEGRAARRRVIEG
ncbi:MAG TPA: prephenate dehydrogenase/arogenate dehydrogenase family protein, partial [Candidatus Hydrogenedentes bacterium]|nr:prephenate dehydrogenase/arogenate dehydrogenase family protein [Candidatus Hydrogenedentota bacterium]